MQKVPKTEKETRKYEIVSEPSPTDRGRHAARAHHHPASTGGAAVTLAAKLLDSGCQRPQIVFAWRLYVFAQIDSHQQRPHTDARASRARRPVLCARRTEGARLVRRPRLQRGDV